MKTINHICAIFIKQIKDSLKNRLVLVVFFMFPILALVFKEIVSEVELDFILPSFITMNTVMVPIIFMSSIVSEEKEKKTLRMLIMSNVKAWEYLIGVGFCVFLLALISNCFFLFIIPFNAKEIVTFIVSSIIGIILSLVNWFYSCNFVKKSNECWTYYSTCFYDNWFAADVLGYEQRT